MLIYAPTLVLLGLQIILLPYLDRDDPRVRKGIIIVHGVFFVRYLLWRLLDTVPRFEWTAAVVVMYLFCGFEVVLGIFTMRTQRVLLRPLRRSREADEHANHYGDAPPRVAVMIVTYNESIDIVRRTIIGVTKLDYPNFSVWVLDDGRREWLRELCASLRVGYLTRAENIGYKSGNLNNALEILKTEDPTDFIAVFDADF